MGNFEHAMTKLHEFEGNFADDPDDAGGMTYKGIARKFHPKWPGWERVDLNIANVPGFKSAVGQKKTELVKHLNGMLGYNQRLQEQVTAFYRVNFWDRFSLDLIHNSTIAAWIFCAAVNADQNAIRWAQAAASVNVDGIIGPCSAAALNNMEPADFIKRARAGALRHRLAVIDSHPSQKKFLKSWLFRDGFSGQEIAQILDDLNSGKPLLV